MFTSRHFSTETLIATIFTQLSIFPPLTGHYQPFFKMVQLKTVFSLFLAASGLVSALPSPATETKGTLAPPPDGTANGIYIVNIADDDSTTWQLIGHINETLKETLLATREVDNLDKRDSAKCNGFGTPADE